MSLSDGDDEAPSQWIPLKESAPSAPRRSEARPSFSMDSMFISMFESDEFDVSTNSNGNIETDDASSKMKAKLAAKETSAVKCLKFILLTVLLLASCAFAAVVYTSTNNDETEKFEDTFAVYSQQIEDSVQMSAQNRLEAIGALAFQMQVHAFNANETWPFVTVPFFEDQIFAMKTLTDAFGVLLFPIVSQKDRSDWEKYSIANRHWVNKSYAAQEHKLGKSGEVLPANDETWFDVLWGQGFENPQNPDFSSGIGDRIFGGWDPNNDTIRGPFVYPKRELYFPQWQAAPLSWYSQSTVNQNYAQFEDFYNSTILSMETGHAIMGFAWFDNIVPGNITTMLYPIYRDIYPEDEDGASDVVAFLGVDIYWRDYLTDIFNDDDAGATVVIENNVNQTFTYKIIGESVTFLGEGDLHCKEYDEMVHSFVFGSNLAPSADNQELTYSGAFLHQEWVQYTFRIYPSKDLEENFHSTRPIVYTVVVLLVAIIAAGTFFLYDFVVERRQRIILRTAERSDAIVSSLFPKNVKEQLYLANVADSGAGNDQKHPATKSNKKEEGNGTTLTADSDVSERPQSEKAQGRVSNNSLEGAVADLRTPGIRKLEGPPIAEHYEEATVFFADMVGFTAWSSQRSPADVFTLLETCYGAFDLVAHRRGIFKVETIGDCYVAVSGIPISREDHAVIMAKFAKDILHCLSVELGKLVPILGSATASLAMRVGIHSGPVTAGVLRGERARFQLFGDTVNTAARMESTSVRNRIQLSQATANLLMKAGKGSWIVKRSGEVEAKGKGRMQTFWLKCSVSFPILKPKLEESTEQEPTASESEDASTRGKESDDESSQDKGSVNASSQDKGSDSEKLEE